MSQLNTHANGAGPEARQHTPDSQAVTSPHPPSPPTKSTWNCKPTKRHRISYSTREYARMVGRKVSAVRREIERKARRDANGLVADLGLGVRAYKSLNGGRWAIVVPRELLA